MKKISRLLLIITILFLTNNIFGQSDTTKVVFKPSGKLWGYVFGDYMYKQHTNTFGMSNTQYASIPQGLSSFEFRRIYLGYDYNISEKFSTQVLFAYEGSQFTSDGNRTIYIKSANIRWKDFFHNSDLVFGQMSTPTFATTSEPVWGYRSLEKTIMDMRKIGGSNDLGISLQGKFNDKGDFGYNIMVGNGTGPKPELDKFKKFYGDIYARFINQKLIIDIGADNEIGQRQPFEKSKTTYKGMVAIQTTKFTIGIEAFKQVHRNNTIYTEPAPSVQTDTVNTNISGVSVFARGSIVRKLGYVVRYDYYSPDSKFNSSNTYPASYNGMYTESFILAGLDYEPVKNVHIMPNIWYDKVNNRNTGKSSNDTALRLTLYYIFR